MSSELQIFLSEIFLYFQKKRGFSSPRIKKFSSPNFFYIFKKNELVLSSPKQFSERKIRVFRRGKSAFALLLFMIAKTNDLSVSGRDPCTGISRNAKKNGGASISSVIRLAPPFAKSHWIFFALVPDQKKMEWVFARSIKILFFSSKKYLV